MSSAEKLSVVEVSKMATFEHEDVDNGVHSFKYIGVFDNDEDAVRFIRELDDPEFFKSNVVVSTHWVTLNQGQSMQPNEELGSKVFDAVHARLKEEGGFGVPAREYFKDWEVQP